MLNLLLIILIAYFLGSLPNGIFVSKGIKNVDLREHGSKNSGATNAFRVLGAKYGILVLILDALKGILPIYIADKLGIQGELLVLIGIIAVLGHTFSPFLKFKGGKGVATSLGVYIYLAPIPMLITLIMFFLLVGITKYVSLGSILASVLLPILLLVAPINQSAGNRYVLFAISAPLGLYIIYKHRENLKRLINGTENKFYKK